MGPIYVLRRYKWAPPTVLCTKTGSKIHIDSFVGIFFYLFFFDLSKKRTENFRDRGVKSMKKSPVFITDIH